MEKQSLYEPSQQYLIVLFALADQKITPQSVASAVEAYRAGKSHCLVTSLLEQRHLSSTAVQQYAQAAAGKLRDLSSQSQSDNSGEWALPRSIPKLQQIVSGQLAGTHQPTPTVKTENATEIKHPMAPAKAHHESVDNHGKTKHRSDSRRKRAFDDDGSYEDISGHLEAEVLQPHHRLDIFLRNLTFGYVGFNHFLLVVLVLLIVGLIWFLFFL